MSCVGDSGYTPGEIAHNAAVRAAALIREIAAAAIAADNANQLVNNYKKQNAIADRMLKLSERQQQELRRMYDTGEYSISDLAELFSISRPTVYRTLSRQAAA